MGVIRGGNVQNTEKTAGTHRINLDVRQQTRERARKRAPRQNEVLYAGSTAQEKGERAIPVRKEVDGVGEKRSEANKITLWVGFGFSGVQNLKKNQGPTS